MGAPLPAHDTIIELNVAILDEVASLWWQIARASGLGQITALKADRAASQRT